MSQPSAVRWTAPPPQPQWLKCVAVGDNTVGKTCLFTSYVRKSFPTEYIPTVFDGWAETVKVRDVTCTLALVDTADIKDWPHRPLMYTQTNVFLVCFSVASVASFENVREKWLPEIRHHCPEVPFILVGTKTDLRDSQQARGKLEPREKQRVYVQSKAGHQLARELGAVKYLECSALTHKGVKDVFDKVIMAGIQPLAQAGHPEKPRRCLIL